MRKLVCLFSILFIFTHLNLIVAQHPFNPQLTIEGKGKVNTGVDNMGYWMLMVKKGYVKRTPFQRVPAAINTGSIIRGEGIRTQDSPDIPTTAASANTQSENSVIVNPEDEEVVFNSNNSGSWSGSTTMDLYGADGLVSENAGLSWAGSILGTGGTNCGDPAVAIDHNGWYFLGKISSSFGQSVAHSSDQGMTWSDIDIAGVSNPGVELLDKNHLCADVAPESPYRGNLYTAWTKFVDDGERGQIALSRSTDHGNTWSVPVTVSTQVYAGAHNQGVNIQTGPDGEVYAVWSVYDAFPGDENTIGFARSLNGGSLFMPATRIIENIRGIRASGTAKNMRVNSFPSMAVDISEGIHKGAIYVVWANRGTPGINTGTDIDVYMIRSFDKGTSWSSPVKVNQDQAGIGKNHFLPWISCDPDNGNLAVIYYDDRNTSSSQCETYISYSYDAGDTWTDLKVSDVAFTPAPISGMAVSYFGDYLGITSKNRKIYPVWTDNRSGSAMSYVSPVDLGPQPGQPFVVYDSYSLNKIGDTATIEMNYGDSLFLSLGLKNIGDQPVTGITASLSTQSPYITITDSVQQYGDFLPGEMKVVPQGFSFKVSDTIPDGLKIKFHINAISADTNWLSNFSVFSHAPDLKVTSVRVIDTTGTGNHNNNMDPGEDVRVQFRIVNPGDFTSDSVFVILNTTSQDIEIPYDTVFLGDIVPRATRYPEFEVRVSDFASFGSWADLIITTVSGKYRTTKTFIEKIGSIAEDWESGDFSKFPWTFSGNSDWTITDVNPFEGNFSGKSGHILDDESSTLKIDYTSGVADSISFYLKTSSETSYDFLRFYIDNIKQGEWSGETGWRRVAFSVPSGLHNYKWSYLKDVYMNGGEDCAWVDDIRFPPPVLPVINPGGDDTICAGMNYHLTGTATLYDSLKWQTYGDGTFSNDTIASPDYIPGTSDINSGSVKLSLTAWGQNGYTSKTMNLVIGSLPATGGISYWPNDSVCANHSITLSVDSVSGSTYLWTPGGYTASETDIDTTGLGLGTFKIKILVRSPLGCTVTDSINLTFSDCTGLSELPDGAYLSVYPNPFTSVTSISLNSTLPGETDMYIADETGRIIKNIIRKAVIKGIFTFAWNGKDDHNTRVTPGVYYVIISTNGKQTVHKIILLP